MNIDLSAVMTSLVTTGTQVGLKILGALAIWIIGKMVINFVLNLLTSSMERQKVDSTITSYL